VPLAVVNNLQLNPPFNIPDIKSPSHGYVMEIPSVYQGILEMLTFFLSLLFTGGSLAATNVDSFYPPLNHTTYITNASLGTYGGVFNAPSDKASAPPTELTYNYCSMPHPHVDTYELPGPVKERKVKAKIVYLEYLQRHQRRTPYNILPGGEVSAALHR
jgi:acid phosphatase